MFKPLLAAVAFAPVLPLIACNPALAQPAPAMPKAGKPNLPKISK